MSIKSAERIKESIRRAHVVGEIFDGPSAKSRRQRAVADERLLEDLQRRKPCEKCGK
jgi:hypothetical protein